VSPASAAPDRPAGSLEPFLSLRSRLVAQRLGDGGLDVCRALSEAMDACLTRLAAPLAGEQFAVVAVGGYGRSELCLYSDIDLMLLHAGQVPQRAIESILYPLWDAGLKVGHAVRSSREAIAAAAASIATLTALLDARAVAGDTRLLDGLLHGLGVRLRGGRLPFRVPLAAAEQARRLAEPYQLLDADLKDGRGGLRSLQSVHWERRQRQLVDPHAAAPPSREELLARASLLAMRNALHSAAGRAYERCVFELRPAAAAWLGLEPREAGRRLYSALREVDLLAAQCWSLQEDDDFARDARVPLVGAGRLPRFLAQRRSGRSMRQPSADSAASASPLVIAARALDRGHGRLALTPREQEVIRSGGVAGWEPAERAALLRLLSWGRSGWTAFKSLESLGWVGRVLPEWRHVVAAPQDAPFHLHPVDVHLWRTVIELQAIAATESDEPWCHEVALELGSIDETLLAGLLHDIGKGWPGDHSETGAAATAALLRRAGFGPATTARVSATVRQHLVLANTAMRRDIDDPLVVASVADRAGDLQTLRMLFLVTVADARATGPSVWNPWKASLVRSLFASAARELERRSGLSPRSAAEDELLDAIFAASEPRVDRSLIAQHLEAMPRGYSAAFPLPDLLRHLEAMVPPPPADAAVVDVRPAGPASNVVVAAEDRPGLLATVSGVLALHNISVLDGRFYTRADGIALEVFHVDDALGSAIEESRWNRVRRDLLQALRGELPLDTLLHEKAFAYRHSAPSSASVNVVVGTEPSERSGVVEVHCADRIGLLHQIARCLFDLGLDIRVAKIDTQGNGVVDTFYVRDPGADSAPDPRRLAELAQELRARLEAPA
jgi:[protein-PII] uridylyltransferase